MEDAVDRLTPGALVKHPLKYTERSPLSRQPAGGLMRKVLFDISMSLDGFYGGAWRGPLFVVGDHPNAATNLRFGTSNEN